MDGPPRSRDFNAVSLFACKLSHSLALPQRRWGSAAEQSSVLQQHWPQHWPRRLTRVAVSSIVSYGQCLLTCDLQEHFLHLCAAPTGTSATEGSSCRCCLGAECLGPFYLHHPKQSGHRNCRPDCIESRWV